MPERPEDFSDIRKLALTGSVDGFYYPGGSLRALQRLLAYIDTLEKRLLELNSTQKLVG